MVDDAQGFGVGWQILCGSSYDAEEVSLLLALLDRRRRHFGDGVLAIDGGANIGVHTVEFARHMYEWGRVAAFEAQELVFYALAGNIALNNFGSLALRERADNLFIGQEILYNRSAGNAVTVVTLDSLGLERVDLIKLDIEGMEIEALRGESDPTLGQVSVVNGLLALG
jgi:FkbM family methyltransferase